nr:MAG: aconitase subunit 2 [Actinomycetota bacterium]
MIRVLVPGTARGPLPALAEPLSFWGGVDPATGEIVEPAHPQYRESVAGRVLVMPHGRGSSSSSSVLAELLRIGSGPAAIVLREPDSILVIGTLVARELYGTGCPVVVTDAEMTDGTWRVDTSVPEVVRTGPY